MNYLANILTTLSLLGGFVSIIFSLEQHFTFACWAIISSVIFDGLDGQVARQNRIPSEFGKELDSLVDVVTFGIAPSVLGYIFIYRSFYLLAAIVLFIYLFCSVMRLAVYNITPKKEMADYFYGLPTTMSGGVLASFILIYRKGKFLLPLPEYVPDLFLVIVLALSVLMVSKIKYLNLDGLRKRLGKSAKLISFLIVSFFIILASMHKAGTALLSIFLIYLLFSPFMVKKNK